MSSPKRTTISIDKDLYEWAKHERLKEFNGNFSQYIAALIRADKKQSAGSKYPKHRDDNITRIEEGVGN